MWARITSPVRSAFAPAAERAKQTAAHAEALGLSFLKSVAVLLVLMMISCSMLLFSAFSYSSFYYYYIPQHVLEKPVFFDYGLDHNEFTSSYSTGGSPQATGSSPVLPWAHHTPPPARPVYVFAGQGGVPVGFPWQGQPPKSPRAVVNLLNYDWITEATHVDFSTLQLYKPDQDRMLAHGQSYDVHLDLKLSERGLQEMGTIMVQMNVVCRHPLATATKRASSGTSSELPHQFKLLATSSRPLPLPYTSWPIALARKGFWMVPLLFGWVEEATHLSLGMFEELQEDDHCKAAMLNITLSANARRLNIISSRVRFHVKLYGLQYLMYEWFFTCAAIGILQITMVQLGIFLLVVWLVYSRCIQDTPLEQDIVQFFAYSPPPPLHMGNVPQSLNGDVSSNGVSVVPGRGSGQSDNLPHSRGSSSRGNASGSVSAGSIGGRRVHHRAGAQAIVSGQEDDDHDMFTDTDDELGHSLHEYMGRDASPGPAGMGIGGAPVDLHGAPRSPPRVRSAVIHARDAANRSGSRSPEHSVRSRHGSRGGSSDQHGDIRSPDSEHSSVPTDQDDVGASLLRRRHVAEQ